MSEVSINGVLIIFLLGQLGINLAVLFRLASRVAILETHIIHLMRKQGMHVRSTATEYDEGD